MATDMTKGSSTRHLLAYAWPLVLGNCFQLAYNAVDSIIAGRFIGKEALAAEGIAGPVMNLVILAITGVCMGAGVLMSEYYGAKNEEKLKAEFSTTVLFGAGASLVVAALGAALTGPLLRALQTPEDIFSITAVYLRITFLGAPFTYFYNALASALKSVGDARTPLKFLMASSILNAVLDLIFIGGLGFGIVCSATTTVVAEGMSALLSVCYVKKHVPLLWPQAGGWRIDGGMLKTTLRYGSVTALQQAVQPIGKLLIQGQVNALGVEMIAAFNACTRVDDFAFTPEQSISHGITTYVAQNRGAKKPERIREGFRSGLRLEVCYWVMIGAAAFFLRRPIMGLFVTGEGAEEVVALGSRYLGTMALFYLLPGFTNGVQGFFRGMGNMGVTLLGTLVQTSLRVVFTMLLAPRLGIYGISFACAIGWSVMLLVEVPYYFRYTKKCGLRGTKKAAHTG